ncbi:hypothetical protein GWK91_01435 [Virgibacillus sp. MSP4-1]|uniref:competence protein CoiA n=1 Tax=Virgibacillus sp. MSP4-1 TaxID=2700081 RepID=UPI00039DEE46|nr:competence protein CoiA family protein [Virgibacillus sp. MSP4-1]QHS21695.1 hypothetical protein GWK91_01435 [Virgibacillus sp. MSP4-1]
MLKAVDRNGTPILLINKTRQELADLRREIFYCPQCNEQVFIRAGEKVMPHYAHFQQSSCPNRHNGEGDYHSKGKAALYEWFSTQGIPVEMEYYLSSIQQRPDLLVKWSNRYFAIEYQCAVISPTMVRERTRGYRKAGIFPIWILGENRLKRRGTSQIKATHFDSLFIQKFTPDTQPQILFYNPVTDLMTSLVSPSPIKSRIYGRIRSWLLSNSGFQHFFLKSQVLNPQVYEYWLNEKKRFRSLRAKYAGSSDKRFISWLYSKGLHPQYLPSEIHLPVPHHFLMDTPTYIWQSKILLDIIKPLSVGKTFMYNELRSTLQSTQKRCPLASIYLEETAAVEEYLHLLEGLQILSRVNEFTFRKEKEVVFPRTLEQAINRDSQLLNQLVKLEKQTRLHVK